MAWSFPWWRRTPPESTILDQRDNAGRTPVRWHRVALIVARRTGKRVGLDTATRMLGS